MAFHVDTRDLPRGKHELGEEEPTVQPVDPIPASSTARDARP